MRLQWKAPGCPPNDEAKLPGPPAIPSRHAKSRWRPTTLRCGTGLDNRNFDRGGGHFVVFPARKREQDLGVTSTDFFGHSDRGPKARGTLSVEYHGLNTE